MDNSSLVYEALARWQIAYERHDHGHAHTIGDCLVMPFITDEVVICKNIFLCNRQQTHFYLLLISPLKSFRTSQVSRALGVSRLSFAPNEMLAPLLGLEAGAVSPLGLLLDEDHRISLVCDEALKKAPRIAFHPLVNTSTVIFDGGTFWNQLLPKMGVKPIFVTCEGP
ncbi:MAG: prolyl-tRNA synthetase associated domain-containing protein [Clostridia bacterium]|nr:prolyl-tRNA synthetase associated domain-containing protein [Clostridia bacterium]